jgi:hypothetical protein
MMKIRIGFTGHTPLLMALPLRDTVRLSAHKPAGCDDDHVGCPRPGVRCRGHSGRDMLTVNSSDFGPARDIRHSELPLCKMSFGLYADLIDEMQALKSRHAALVPQLQLTRFGAHAES